MDNLNIYEALTFIGVCSFIFVALYFAVKASDSKMDQPNEKQNTTCINCGNPHPHSYQSGRYYCHECGIDW
jgi:hypothetical protein